MTEDRLRQLLRDEPVPGSGEARQRGRRLVEGAYERRPRRARRPLPGIAAAIATVVVLSVGALSPAGAAVRDWVGDVFATGVPETERGLIRVPGGGRLLVRSTDGPWVVRADGSRRLLGDYEEASWSPHGIFVAATSGRTLSALEPDGTPRWSLTAPAPVADPRWLSPSGERIAYRAGPSLRVVAGDGTEDRLLDRRVAPVSPAWSPRGLQLLAYVDADGDLRLVGSEDETLASARALPGIETLEWAGERSTLLESSPLRLRLRAPGQEKLLGAPDLTAILSARPPAGAEIGAAALSPDGGTVAAVFSRERREARRGEVVLVDADSGERRRLFSVRGRLGRLEWSPDGRRLLVSWPEADQWLFIPASGNGRVRASGGIATQFDPGAGGSARFPAVEGWCCRATAGG